MPAAWRVAISSAGGSKSAKPRAGQSYSSNGITVSADALVNDMTYTVGGAAGTMVAW